MRASSNIILLGTAVLALSACSQNPRPGARAVQTVQGIGNTQQIADVMGALETGDQKRARMLLKNMAVRDPLDKRVAVLRESIDGDPVALLGARSFNYRVERGDTMPTLSQRFLGDRLKFFLLARYNGLKDGHVEPGATIRIPGTEPVAPPVVVRPRPEAPPPKPTPSAAPSVKPTTPNPRLAAALRARALSALNQGRIAEAVVTLRRARTIDPANAAVQRDLIRAERLLSAVRARK